MSKNNFLFCSKSVALILCQYWTWEDFRLSANRRSVSTFTSIFTPLMALLFLLSPLTEAKTPAKKSSPPLSAPAAAAKAFDSLLELGKFPEARQLCTGQVLRMFDLITMAQSQIGAVLDTSLTTEETLEEKMTEPWAYIKVISKMVFKQPIMGQKEMHAVQAIHLYHASRGWLLAEMEELENAQSPVRMRQGRPESDSTPNSAEGMHSSTLPASQPSNPSQPSPSIPNPDSLKLFPTSSKAPAEVGLADEMQIRIRLKNGASLENFCPQGPDQKKLKAESPSQWILQNRFQALPSSKLPSLSTGQSSPYLKLSSQNSIDSLKPFLTSNAYLLLDDSLLNSTAAQIIGAEKNPVQATEKIYAWVVENFHFQLGAVLFGNSHDVLRNITGDCSEAAILTAALLRSRGIPSRLALGFATLGHGVFIGHAWCEARLGENWIGVDAALRQFPVGVERIKLVTLDGKSDMRIAATNLMMSVLSNLEIEILSASQKGKNIPLKTFANNSGEGAAFFQQILNGINAKPLK